MLHSRVRPPLLALLLHVTLLLVRPLLLDRRCSRSCCSPRIAFDVLTTSLHLKEFHRIRTSGSGGPEISERKLLLCVRLWFHSSFTDFLWQWKKWNVFSSLYWKIRMMTEMCVEETRLFPLQLEQKRTCQLFTWKNSNYRQFGTLYRK